MSVDDARTLRPRAPAPQAQPTTRADESLRERWEAAAASLRERFDEPISRATQITRRTLAWFPVRVWRHFLRSNGFLLAASISYQSLFAIFAVIYVAFAVLGMWVGGSDQAVTRMITIVNQYIPGLIGVPPDNGLISQAAVAAVAQDSSGVLALTGAIAVVVAGWTAIGFVTFTRRAVRDTFGLPFDVRNYFVLKARDLFASVLFGASFIVGAVIGFVAAGALDFLLGLIGLQHHALWSELALKLLSGAVAFAINAAAFAGLFRFLTGTSLPWRTIWPGSLLGGGATAILQVGVGFLFVYTPSNPLLATFSVLIAFLLWFRLVGIVILVSASWIATAAADRKIPLHEPSDAERLLAEHEALLLAAHVRLREARADRAQAPWYRRRRTDRAVRTAEEAIDRLEAEAPPSRPSTATRQAAG